MVSEVLKRELRLVNERLRITIIILLFWVIVVTLDVTGVIGLATEGPNFLVYAILGATAIIFLVLGLGIQIEPVVKEIIKNRKNIEQFWESEPELKPSIEKRTKISEAILIIAIILMLVSLLFISV